MHLYLAASYPEAQGGVKYLSCVDAPSPERMAVGEARRERERVQLRILLSYWYYKDADLDKLFAKYFTPPYPDVFADSGGFSAMTQNAQINIQEYADWIKRYKHLFSTYANLDSIGNAEKTLANQKTLEDMGLAPLPVFHASANYKPLEDYLAAGYRYIALGGLVPYSAQPKTRMRFLIQAFKMAGKEAVYHGFGVTSWEVMSQLPWYSVDSSSWGQGFRFGSIPLFDSRAGRFEKCKLGDYETCNRYSRLIEELGFDWQDFADRKRNDRTKICAISALSYIKAEQFLRRKFGERYIPTRDDAPADLRAHLADANPQRFGDVDAGLRIHLADTGGIKENYARAEAGVKLHLADARGHSAADLSAAENGLKLHLAEHSLDRGGLGDTSRANDYLAKGKEL